MVSRVRPESAAFAGPSGLHGSALRSRAYSASSGTRDARCNHRIKSFGRDHWPATRLWRGRQQGRWMETGLRGRPEKVCGSRPAVKICAPKLKSRPLADAQGYDTLSGIVAPRVSEGTLLS